MLYHLDGSQDQDQKKGGDLDPEAILLILVTLVEVVVEVIRVIRAIRAIRAIQAVLHHQVVITETVYQDGVHHHMVLTCHTQIREIEDIVKNFNHQYD
jgi:hypothetical protein